MNGETERNGVWFPEDGDSCHRTGWIDRKGYKYELLPHAASSAQIFTFFRKRRSRNVYSEAVHIELNSTVDNFCYTWANNS
jgi:hypothetical protein